MPKGIVSTEKRCKGKNRMGEPCKKAALPGRNWCKFHGGAALAGPAHPSFKNGKYSKYMPEKLRERYETLLEDPDLTTNRNEIAALESRMTQLIEQAEEDVSILTWKQMIKLWNQFMFAVRNGDAGKQAQLVGEINDFINSRSENDLVWRDIESLSDTRRRLADSEQRRLVAMNQMLTVEQAMMLMGTLISSIKDVVYLYADSTAAKHIIDGTSQAYIELIGVRENSSDGARVIDGG